MREVTSRELTLRKHLLEVALVMCTVEFMADNSENLYEFFIEEEMKQRRLKYQNQIFNEELNLRKAKKIVGNYQKKREKMMSYLNLMDYESFESELDDRDLLDHFMNVINELIFEFNDFSKLESVITGIQE